MRHQSVRKWKYKMRFGIRYFFLEIRLSTVFLHILTILKIYWNCLQILQLIINSCIFLHILTISYWFLEIFYKLLQFLTVSLNFFFTISCCFLQLLPFVFLEILTNYDNLKNSYFFLGNSYKISKFLPIVQNLTNSYHLFLQSLTFCNKFCNL